MVTLTFTNASNNVNELFLFHRHQIFPGIADSIDLKHHQEKHGKISKGLHVSSSRSFLCILILSSVTRCSVASVWQTTWLPHYIYSRHTWNGYWKNFDFTIFSWNMIVWFKSPFTCDIKSISWIIGVNLWNQTSPERDGFTRFRVWKQRFKIIRRSRLI